MRIFIIGGPKTGKTTSSFRFAKKYNLSIDHIIHTDDYINSINYKNGKPEVYKTNWKDLPQLIIGDLAKHSDGFIVEGVQGARILRKILERKIESLLPDKIYLLNETFEDLDKNQLVMTKGCKTVWDSISNQLTCPKVIISKANLLAPGFLPE